MYLEIKNLVKYYKKNIPLIKKLNFSIKKGEIISFIGESGSGKTTFLKCISGLEKINSGSIFLNNLALNDENIFVKPQNRKIGFVFQDYPLFPHLNLKENILFNLNKKYLKSLEYMLSLTGLSKLIYRFPHELSGGEQQRACIARALIREPELLLLDEPFSNLDSSIKNSIKEEIHKIIKKTGTTTILVTHDIKDSLNISDRILIFKAGVLQQYDNPVKMYCEPANCYCGKILGDLNKIRINEKNYYLRPEKIKISKKSPYQVIIKKSYFQGKEYKILGAFNNEPWHFFSKDAIIKGEKIYITFKKEDLIFFDSLCENFFT
tara:strand:- start:1870 stop:2832 length:963 start_codon:yes stop_codon:yes gene_type:complete